MTGTRNPSTTASRATTYPAMCDRHRGTRGAAVSAAGLTPPGRVGPIRLVPA